jgi:hypothetical protein
VLIRWAISSRLGILSRCRGLQSNRVCFQMIRSALEMSERPEIGFEFIVCVENAFQLILKCAQLNAGICKIDILINCQRQPIPHKSILDIILNGKVRVGLSLDRSFMTEPSSKAVLFKFSTSKISVKNQLHEKIKDTRLI